MLCCYESSANCYDKCSAMPQTNSSKPQVLCYDKCFAVLRALLTLVLCYDKCSAMTNALPLQVLCYYNCSAITSALLLLELCKQCRFGSPMASCNMLLPYVQNLPMPQTKSSKPQVLCYDKCSAITTIAWHDVKAYQNPRLPSLTHTNCST